MSDINYSDFWVNHLIIIGSCKRLAEDSTILIKYNLPYVCIYHDHINKTAIYQNENFHDIGPAVYDPSTKNLAESSSPRPHRKTYDSHND